MSQNGSLGPSSTKSEVTHLAFLGYFLLEVAAVLIYGIGLIAPLTPSEGRPTATEFAIFLGLPIAVSLVPVLISRRPKLILLAVPALATIAYFAWGLLPVWLR